MNDTTFKYKIKHSASRFGSILPWLLISGFIFWGLWTAFNKPTQKVTVEKGGTATFINKTSRFFIPFTEIGIGKSSEKDFDTFIKIGIRIEF